MYHYDDFYVTIETNKTGMAANTVLNINYLKNS